VSEVRALLLAAGLGTRLRPITNHYPKCLVPIGGRPLLEHWLCSLYRSRIQDVWVNLHHHQDIVHGFLSRKCFSDWVNGILEPALLGTAGTLSANANIFRNSTTLLAHADNWCQCDFNAFLDFHRRARPFGTVMTMMTFRTATPESCGVADIDDQGVVQAFYEKIPNTPTRSNLANGAVYLIEPEIVSWLEKRPQISDFSTEVIPEFLGRIATWENTGIHRDIGVIHSLLAAQDDPSPKPCWSHKDDWMDNYEKAQVHSHLADARQLLS